MRRLLFALTVILFATSAGFAQEQQTDQSHLVLPMFGNKTKTEAQQQKDEKFLTSCDKSFTNRQEASQFFMERGWEYFNEGQVDTAMYRFNLAWLLNPNNMDTYWAFGLISASKDNNKEALTYYEKAKAIDPKNSMLLSDMASAQLAIYKNGKKKKKELKKATALLDESIAANAQNAYALYNYSLVRFYEKKYPEAWDYLHKSRILNMSVIDYTYISELVEIMPDPQGFFRSSDAVAEQE
ncbi:Tfp pilus assembly protein PilF [Pontibacter aydingkolensis]|uniref:Tetratricopeptide repeat-containing protein n=1 Tax=Pontibacter aydingkolensis TaxID=1911536 RepID=A0ABS7CTV9_9BACT|nr:hypothetical protein [Pontibacter aydingkolensis]MBW7467290.1 hypothetical protein [Pontibacter aydingkolensis]